MIDSPFDHPSPATQMEFTVRIATDQADVDAIINLRRRVFRDEQGLIGNGATDADDPASVHVVAERQGELASYGRLTPPGQQHSDAYIAWVATLPACRKQGAATLVITRLLEIARSNGYARVLISAQTSQLPFYRQFGFEHYGDRFVVRGIQHQFMQWNAQT